MAGITIRFFNSTGPTVSGSNNFHILQTSFYTTAENQRAYPPTAQQNNIGQKNQNRRPSPFCR
jgi:hypothetical protein